MDYTPACITIAPVLYCSGRHDRLGTDDHGDGGVHTHVSPAVPAVCLHVLPTPLPLSGVIVLAALKQTAQPGAYRSPLHRLEGLADPASSQWCGQRVDFPFRSCINSGRTLGRADHAWVAARLCQVRGACFLPLLVHRWECLCFPVGVLSESTLHPRSGLIRHYTNHNSNCIVPMMKPACECCCNLFCLRLHTLLPRQRAIANSYLSIALCTFGGRARVWNCSVSQVQEHTILNGNVKREAQGAEGCNACMHTW